MIFSVYVSTSGSRILFDSLHSLAVPGRQCFNMSSRKAERSEVYPGSRSQSQSFLLLGPGSRPGTTKGIMFSSQFRDDRRNNVQFAVPGRQHSFVISILLTYLSSRKSRTFLFVILFFMSSRKSRQRLSGIQKPIDFTPGSRILLATLAVPGRQKE